MPQSFLLISYLFPSSCHLLSPHIPQSTWNLPHLPFWSSHHSCYPLLWLYVSSLSNSISILLTLQIPLSKTVPPCLASTCPCCSWHLWKFLLLQSIPVVSSASPSHLPQADRHTYRRLGHRRESPNACKYYWCLKPASLMKWIPNRIFPSHQHLLAWVWYALSWLIVDQRGISSPFWIVAFVKLALAPH